MGFFEELGHVISKLTKEYQYGKTSAEEDFNNSKDKLIDVVREEFHGPLKSIPKNRSEVYEIYGRAPEETNPAHKDFPKAKMTTSKELPGNWNNGSHKLYMLAYMESYLKEALSRCERIGVLDYIEQLGCYNYRPIRNDPSRPLSYHSWGAAVDINPRDNSSLYKKTKKLAPPFSKQYLEHYPYHVPYELVLAFKSVGFTWGGDWGNSEWIYSIRQRGIGWDASNEKYWPDSWNKITYYDPMHFELISRGTMYKF